ncbi:hypothetical protein ES703_112237 [subsurface metagenome]
MFYKDSGAWRLRQKMAKDKKRVRVREFVHYTNALAHYDNSAIMRDMHPDEPYEILAVGLVGVSKLGKGIVGYVALARNVDAEEPDITLGKLVSKTGVFLHWEPNSTEVAGNTSVMTNDYRRFDPPIKFDENDQLNMHIYSGGANILTFVVEVFYRLI